MDLCFPRSSTPETPTPWQRPRLPPKPPSVPMKQNTPYQYEQLSVTLTEKLVHVSRSRAPEAPAPAQVAQAAPAAFPASRRARLRSRRTA